MQNDAMPRRVRYFLDTEFLENGATEPLYLLSIGLVSEDGRTYYAQDSSCPLARANSWVRENVLPCLDRDHWRPRGTIVRQIREFIGNDKPEFWVYYGDYDWVVFCQLFGAMVDLPKGWPMWARDLKQLCWSLGDPDLPQFATRGHNALDDAYEIRERYFWLEDWWKSHDP